MTCPSCRVFDGVTTIVLREWPARVTSDPPRCAFDANGVFTDDNWNCGTLNALRGQHGHEVYSNDQWLKTIAADGKFIVLGWYKSRGRVEIALVVSETESRPLTLADALAVTP